MNVVQYNSLREDVGQWIASLDSALTSALSRNESNSLIREIFAAFLLLRWADLHDTEQEAMAIFEERIYQPLLPESLQWRRWAHLDNPYAIADRLGELARYLEVLRGDAVHPMAAYLRVLTLPLRRVLEVNFVYLYDLVRWVDELPFETHHERRALLNIFDQVMAETGDQFDGQFRTPANISDLVVALANPQPGESVYDPCFGFGNLLVSAWKHAEDGPNNMCRPSAFLEIAGIEKNINIFLIGLTRMLLAGVDVPRLEHGDSLERESLSNPSRDGFDVALVNPPIGVKTSPEAWRYHQYAVLTKDSVGLFIQHTLSQLKPHGRAVIVVPESFLFRGGAERELRRHLLEQGQVDAVVGLPAGSFAPNVGIKCCCLVLNKQGGASSVRMVDAAPLFEQRSGKKAPIIRDEMAYFLASELRRPELRRPIKGFDEITPDRGLISRASWEISSNDLEAIDWDLSPRRREKGGLDELLSNIKDALGNSALLVQLSDVAQVMAGRSVKSAELLDEPPLIGAVGYVRIKDISQGKVERSTSWLLPEIANNEQRWALLPGDVLVSKSGTIGKTALVRNGAVGAVAASGFYVLRPDKERLDAGFLMAYLASPVCQNWLAAQSRGAVIQHLNRAVLDGLPVPLPPLQMQARAAAQFREFGTDVLAFLSQVSGSGESDRLTTWLAEFNNKVPVFVQGLEDTPALSLIEPLIAMASTAQRWVSEEKVSNQSARWLKPFTDALLQLTGVAQIPASSALFSVLQDGERDLAIVQEIASGHLPTESLARTIVERLRDWLRSVVADLVNEISLRISSSPDALTVGSFVEFSVVLVNDGLLPLRGVRIETQPDWGVAQTAYLAEGQSLAVNLRGDVPKQTGQFTLFLYWQARTLAGESVDGKVELAIRVIEPELPTTTLNNELGGSPYVTGSPLAPKHGHDVFFGRETLIEQISRQIATHGNVVLLEGNRRAGKTSILKHLEGRTAVPGWLAVYSSLQGAEGATQVVGVPTVEVFREIARSIAAALTKIGIEVPLPNGKVIEAGKPALGVARACREGISEESPFVDFRDYLQLVLTVLESLDLGLLMMLDEFDKLQEGIDNGVTSPQVPENIRFLIQTYPKFSAILTGSRRLKRLREQYWSALYGLGTSIPVTALDAQSARSVVTQPVKDKLTFSNEAVERVIEITARQPYLMQCLCNRVFDYAVQTKSRSITLGVVNDSANNLVRDNEHFASLWDYAGLGPETGRQRRQLILLLCALSFKQDTHINFGSLHEQLAQAGVDVDNEALDVDLAYLRELELVEFSGEIGDGQYRLAIPLMADWIEQQQDADVVASRAQAEMEEESD